MGAVDDNWFITHARGLPRRRRFEDLLFDRKLRALDIKALVDHVDQLEDEIAALTMRLARAEPGRPPGHVLFFPTPDRYELAEADDPPPPCRRVLLLEPGSLRVQRIRPAPSPHYRRP